MFVAVRSAGIILYRQPGPEVLLAHPGGPFWASKDEGAWSIPKGVCEPGEEEQNAARREFTEEVGALPSGTLAPLGEFLQPSRKIVIAFTLEGDFDPIEHRSNTFELEWPPRSGQLNQYPEVDRVQWFDLKTAFDKLLKGQRPMLEALLRHLETGSADSALPD
jgi:predicted NUDIX family NTP pyrophosphohydrolase